MSEHTLVVEVDTAYAEKFPQFAVEHTWHVECSDPRACPGWIECDVRDEAHHDNEDGEDEKTLHGVLHSQFHYGYGWVLDYEGCPLEMADLELPDGLDEESLEPGRYPVDADWDDESVYLTLIKPVPSGA